MADPRIFVCKHGDPRCRTDPCPAGIAWMCNAPADHPARATPRSAHVRHALVQDLADRLRTARRPG